MHSANLDIALAELRAISVADRETKKNRRPATQGDLTSIAASVMTEFMVSSCKARDLSPILRRSKVSESAMSRSEAWKPFWASNSSSRHAVCSETWNRVGSPRASGHQEVRNGFEVAFRSRG